MTFNFTVKEFILGGGNATPTLQFYKRGFNLGGSVSPSWQDVILSGNTALTLVNAKEDGLNYLKLFGGTEQNGTPTPDNPIDIVCNNGVVKVNTTGSGKNAIDTSDTGKGFLNSTVGQEPNINSSTASAVIKRAIKVSNGKKYKFSYYSNVPGSREIDIVNNNGVVALKSILTCDVGLNEYIIEANTDGYLWVTVQFGDFATVKPTAYEIGLYVDGTTETVEVHSKNLFDKNNALLNTTVTEDGSFETNNSFNCSNYIPVKYGKTYIRSNNGTRFGVRYHLYDSNKNWLGYVDAAQTGLIVVNNSSAKYVAFAISKTVNLDNVQVEQGSTVTAYEPYFNGGSATAEMLLKVGTYQDVQEVLSGDVTRNVGIKVLDGTENIYDGTSGYWGIASSYFPNIKMKTSGAILATSWGEGDYLSSTGAYCSIVGTSYFAFNKASLPNASTAEAVKQWLADQYNAGTPVIIVYPLATSTTETVTAQPLTIQEGTNIVEITQASINNLGLEVSYKAGVVVTITEVQNANLSNSVTVTIGG